MVRRSSLTLPSAERPDYSAGPMVSLDDPRARSAYADPEPLPRMSFGDHLDELRRRLFRAVGALLVAVIVLTPFKDEVQGIVIEPYRILWRQAFRDHVAGLAQREHDGTLDPRLGKTFLTNCREMETEILGGSFAYPHMLPTLTGFPVPYTLVATEGLADFWTFMMATFVFAFVLAGPVVVWQMWAFIAAGLYQKERQIFYRYFPFAMVLLSAGVLFGYYFAVPYGLGWLIRLMKTDQVSALLSVNQYFTLMFTLTAAMGLIFQLPLVMVALQRIGLVRHSFYIKKWRAIVLIIFILSALITPPDPFSMMLMAAPTLCLYLLGLVLTAAGRKHERPEDVARDAASSP